MALIVVLACVIVACFFAHIIYVTFSAAMAEIRR